MVDRVAYVHFRIYKSLSLQSNAFSFVVPLTPLYFQWTDDPYSSLFLLPLWAIMPSLFHLNLNSTPCFHLGFVIFSNIRLFFMSVISLFGRDSYPDCLTQVMILACCKPSYFCVSILYINVWVIYHCGFAFSFFLLYWPHQSWCRGELLSWLLRKVSQFPRH